MNFVKSARRVVQGRVMEGKKVRNVYVCIKCGRESEKFRNTCPACGSTMVLRTKVEKNAVLC